MCEQCAAAVVEKLDKMEEAGAFRHLNDDEKETERLRQGRLIRDAMGVCPEEAERNRKEGFADYLSNRCNFLTDTANKLKEKPEDYDRNIRAIIYYASLTIRMAISYQKGRRPPNAY